MWRTHFCVQRRDFSRRPSGCTRLSESGVDGIRIHSGNTAADTEGCLLVGMARQGNSVGLSRLAFGSVLEKLRQQFAQGGTVSIEYVNPAQKNTSGDI
jgi:hypothetical protein